MSTQVFNPPCAFQVPPPRPQFMRLQDPYRRNDARNQLRGGDVEPGIQRLAGRVRHLHIRTPQQTSRRKCRGRLTDFTGGPSYYPPRAEDFALVPLFDWNVEAGPQIPVNRGERNRNVKWDSMPLCQNRRSEE